MRSKIAINGFGRIGRNAFKIAFERPDLEIAAVNDLTDTKTLAYLLKHDSTYGAYQHDVGFDDEHIIVNGQPIKVLAEKDPASLPWGDMGVEVVIESTGFFVEPDKARAHVKAGAKRVVISAPAKGESADSAPTVVLGVNDDDLKGVQDVVSNASCTTNCITPVAGVIEGAFGIEKLMMTTIHSYTASQHLQDGPGKNLREARGGAVNITPTTTGASIAAAKALPALEGIFGALEVRVPTPVVSLADFAIVTKRSVTKEEVNEAFKKASQEPFYQGVLDVTEEELVSTDFIGNSHSAIVDLNLTNVVGGNLLKVVAWYDNEWGYSNRLVEVTADTARVLHDEAPEGGHQEMNDVTANSSDQPSSFASEPKHEDLLESPGPEDFLPPMGKEANQPVHNAEENGKETDGGEPTEPSGGLAIFSGPTPPTPHEPHHF